MMHTIFRTPPLVPWREFAPGHRQQSVRIGLDPQLGQQRLDAICSATPAGSSPWQNNMLERRRGGTRRRTEQEQSTQ